MASDVVREFADNIVSSQGNLESIGSSDTFTREISRGSEDSQLASDGSQFSRDVDRWIGGGESPAAMESTGVQGSRVAVVQRSTLARTSSLGISGMWYVIAMVLPLFSINNCTQWACASSAVLNTAEFFMGQFHRVCGSARAQFRRLAQDQVARDLFATAMDIVLVIYAIGFLVLSMYQASIIG